MSLDDFIATYKEAVSSLQSNFQFGHAMNFDTTLPEELPKSEHHAKLIDLAKAHYMSDDVFVDCSTTNQYKTHAESVVPCITPGHPFYSTALKRYLGPEDFMQAQGLWRSCFAPEVYEHIMSSSKKLAQNIAGNSFSSTVCQAVSMIGLAMSANALTRLNSRGGVKRRLRCKQHDPAYDVVKSAKARRKRPKYRRKHSGVDSRKTTSTGKKQMASIWDKEQVCLGTHSKCWCRSLCVCVLCSVFFLGMVHA